MPRSVFHVRLKDFELQAERILDPALRTRAVAIISSNRQDGTIVALSDEARQEGLYPGLKISLVRRMSHSTQLLPYNNALYQRLNGYVYTTVSGFSPLVEPGRYGQYYLDMSGMQQVYRDFRVTGSRITARVHSTTSLSGVVGISPNKLVSSIATAVIPEAVHVVPGGGEARFLAPLSARVLPASAEPAVLKMLRFLFLERVHQIQQVVTRPAEARTLFGAFAPRLSREARGEDTSLVCPPARQEHILEQKILAEDTNDEAVLRGLVQTLAEQLAFKLRRRRQIARRVTVEIHYADGLKNNRTGTLNANDDRSATRLCGTLFSLANYRRNRIRAVLIDASGFRYRACQLELFPAGSVRDLALSTALDRLRQKYGFASCQTARAVGA